MTTQLLSEVPRPPSMSDEPRPGAVILRGDDLTSKWGFDDGELLWAHIEWWIDSTGMSQERARGYISSDHILIALIERHLLPQIEPHLAELVERREGVHSPLVISRDISEVDAAALATVTIEVESEIFEVLNDLYPARSEAYLSIFQALAINHIYAGRQRAEIEARVPRLLELDDDTLKLAAENLACDPELENFQIWGCSSSETAATLAPRIEFALTLARLACEH